MRRRAFIAAAWIAGTTLPTLTAGLFLFGCCVLPFHGAMHETMPMCALATSHGGEHESSTPAQEQTQPVRRMLAETTPTFRIAVADDAMRVPPPSAATSYRSFISLGAVRCDRDVGWHLFVATLLI